MLLRQESADCVDVLSVTGPVEQQDAPLLVHAVEQAFVRRPRGVVVDLAGVSAVAPGALDALRAMTAPTGWPTTALCLCGAAPDVRSALPDVLVHEDRAQALAALDDRRSAPRRSVPIDHDAQGPAQARVVVRQCAEQLGLGDEGEDLLLVVSEMVTNAVRHARPPVELQIAATDERVVVAVADSSPEPPTPRDADADAENGRGMALMALLCEDHGVRDRPPGKTVWAAVRRGRTSPV